jgi:hypothetical protein
VPEAFSFEHTERRAASRASMKPDDWHSPRNHFSISAEDMGDYERNLRKSTSIKGTEEKAAYLVSFGIEFCFGTFSRPPHPSLSMF